VTYVVWLPDVGLPGRIWAGEHLPALPDCRHATVDYEAGSIEEEAGRVAALLDGPAVLVGHGFGSLVAQQLALDSPDLVSRAVLLATFGRTSGYLAELLRGELAGYAGEPEQSARFGLIHDAIMGYPPEVLGDNAAWARVRPVLDELAAADPELIAAQRRAALAFDSLERLAGCRVPLHVVAFGHDLQAPPARGRLVAEAAPDASFVVLEELAHLSLFRHRAAEAGACIRDYVRQEEARWASSTARPR
jgi:pimeloyl-ACP methyl ester carboxylesterase